MAPAGILRRQAVQVAQAAIPQHHAVQVAQVVALQHLAVQASSPQQQTLNSAMSLCMTCTYMYVPTRKEGLEGNNTVL